MSQNPRPETELDLARYLDVFLRRRWIVASAAGIVFLSTALAVFMMRPVYQASALLVIEKERGGGPAESNGTMVENSNDDYYQTQYKLLQSRSLLQRVYDELRLEARPDFQGPGGPDRLQKAILISPVLRSRLVYVRAESHDPRLSADIANALSSAFVDENLSNQLFISKEVLSTLQGREDDPEAFKAYESLPAVVHDQLIQTLTGEYARLEAQAAEMSQKYTVKHPAMIAVRSSMAALKGQIQAETLRIVQSLKTELSGQLRGNNVRIIDPATVPKEPVRPKKGVSLLLGLVGGLVLGFAAALLVEFADQSVRTQQDVEEALGLPFLGLIPFSQHEGGPCYASLLSNELSLTSEAVRNLRTMIDFAGATQRAGAFLVTSTEQAEGKTYVSSNLAVVFSQLGERVLLIDGDLRRPSLHKNFGVSSQRGLSDFLAHGREASEAGELLVESEIPNLKILPCGPRPPNPSELLNTPRVAALLAWAGERFDRVIIDCAPIFPVNDTLLWGRHVPSSVFVVRYGQTRLPFVQKACRKLSGSGVSILGVAVNAGLLREFGYTPYGYHYHHYYRSAEPSKA